MLSPSSSGTDANADVVTAGCIGGSRFVIPAGALHGTLGDGDVGDAPFTCGAVTHAEKNTGSAIDAARVKCDPLAIILNTAVLETLLACPRESTHRKRRRLIDS